MLSIFVLSVIGIRAVIAQSCNANLNITSSCTTTNSSCIGSNNCLDCSFLSWSSIPCWFGPSTTTSTLLTLWLNDNDIITITTGLFSALSSLQYLYLHNNQITALPSDVFSTLSTLLEVDLASNSITSLSGTTFAGLASLITLDLSYNPISVLPSGVFNFSSNGPALNLVVYGLSNVAISTSAFPLSGSAALGEISCGNGFDIGLQCNPLSCWNTCGSASSFCLVINTDLQPNSTFTCSNSSYINPHHNTGPSSSSNKAAVIAGATVGTIVGVSLFLVFIWYLLKTRASKQEKAPLLENIEP